MPPDAASSRTARTLQAVHENLVLEYVADEAIVAVLVKPPPGGRHHSRAVLPAVLQTNRNLSLHEHNRTTQNRLPATHEDFSAANCPAVLVN